MDAGFTGDLLIFAKRQIYRFSSYIKTLLFLNNDYRIGLAAVECGWGQGESIHGMLIFCTRCHIDITLYCIVLLIFKNANMLTIVRVLSQIKVIKKKTKLKGYS